jgi:nicotinamidase-related amidase
VNGPGPLLAVIDMQDVFGDPQSPWATPGFDELTSPIDHLLSSFGDRAVFTRFTLPASIEGSWGPYYEMWAEVTDPERAAWFELAEPWRSKSPRTLDRPTFSKWGSELESMSGPDRTLVVCGVATDCCVVATAIAAADGGQHVRVVADACRGVDAAAHDRALGLMSGFAPQIVITTVEAELQRAASVPTG